MSDIKPPPVVGISGANSSSKSVIAMVAQVRAAGGIPLLLANHDKRNAKEDIAQIDSLIVLGNDADVSPELYRDVYQDGDPRKTIHAQTRDENATHEGAARAAYESQLLVEAMAQRVPTLAICGAMQRLNVLTGGGILQHVPDLVGNENHEQSKADIPGFCPVIPIDIEKESNLGKIAGEITSIYAASTPPPCETALVNENSFHHQAVDGEMLNKNFRIVAQSDHYKKPDGGEARLVEAFEPAPDGKLKDWKMLSVQWHPEFGASPLAPKLIANVVEKGSERAKASSRNHAQDEAMAQSETDKSAGYAGYIMRRKAAAPASLAI